MLLDIMFKLYKSTLPTFTKCYCILANTPIPTSPLWNVLFFGSDEFSLCSLKLLNDEYRKSNSSLNNLEVVTTIGKGRFNGVHNFALNEKLIVHEWPPLIQNSFHVGIVVSFGHLIPEYIIDAFPMGMLNVHASLLPRWRGAAPIIYAIANGDCQTGVTVMRIRPNKFDIGEIIEQRVVDILPNMRMPQLYKILGNLGAETLLSVIKTLPTSLQKSIDQSNAGVTYAPRISPNIATIAWDKLSAKQVFDLSRALDSVYLLTSKWMQHLVKLSDITIDNQHALEGSKPGFASFDKNNNVIKICCADNKCINVGKIIINKKTISAKDFNNGYFKKEKDIERFFK